MNCMQNQIFYEYYNHLKLCNYKRKCSISRFNFDACLQSNLLTCTSTDVHDPVIPLLYFYESDQIKNRVLLLYLG